MCLLLLNVLLDAWREDGCCGEASIASMHLVFAFPTLSSQ